MFKFTYFLSLHIQNFIKIIISEFARFPCGRIQAIIVGFFFKIIKKYRDNIICDWLRTQNLLSILSILLIRRVFFIVWWEYSHVRGAAGGTNVIRKRSFSREKSSSSATRDNGFACRKTPVKLRPRKLRVEVLHRCARLFRILNSRCGEMNKSTRLWRAPRDKYCWIFFWSVFQWIPQWLYLLRYYPQICIDSLLIR